MGGRGGSSNLARDAGGHPESPPRRTGGGRTLDTSYAINRWAAGEDLSDVVAIEIGPLRGEHRTKQEALDAGAWNFITNKSIRDGHNFGNGTMADFKDHMDANRGLGWSWVDLDGKAFRP